MTPSRHSLLRPDYTGMEHGIKREGFLIPPEDERPSPH